jgi:hypothetical protein
MGFWFPNSVWEQTMTAPAVHIEETVDILFTINYYFQYLNEKISFV